MMEEVSLCSLFTHASFQFIGVHCIGFPLPSLLISCAQCISIFNLINNSAHFLTLLILCSFLLILGQSLIALCPQDSTSWVSVFNCMRKIVLSSFKVDGRAKWWSLLLASPISYLKTSNPGNCLPAKKIFEFLEHFLLLGVTLQEAVQNSVGWFRNVFMTYLIRNICFLFTTE